MRSRRRSAAVVFVALLALVLLAVLALPPVDAAFTASTANPGNSFSAQSDFETGYLLTWGGPNRAQTVPARIDANSGYTASAHGSGSACEIRSPGTLWCWGANSTGALGLGDTTARGAPTQVGSDSTWTSVSEGNLHTCATRADSTLWCWGTNSFGELGNGSTTAATVPTQVSSPATTGWGLLTSGWGASCALRADTLWCWGDNQRGQVGDGTTTNRPTPVQVTVAAVSGWRSMSNGDRHTCAISTGAALYCWGTNPEGELGQGNTGAYTGPVAIPGSWSSIGVGQAHTCGIKTDGSLWCWGTNGNGQVGVGSTTNVTSPRQVGSATTWQQVTGGQYHTCATRADTTLWCWGLNSIGQLGDGTIVQRTTPVQVTVPFVTGWSLTTIGAESNRSCALRPDTSLWCWGTVYSATIYPALLDGTTTWRKPTNGLGFDCALRTSGALYCWGGNGNGQLGDGTVVNKLVPTQVGTSTAWTSVSAGQSHTCGIQSDTTLWCWGLNTNGQLGNASTTQATTPAQVTTPAPAGWTQVSAGNSSTCALRADTSLWCWGNNGNGQLGIASTTQQTSPAQVTTPSTLGWSNVSVGASYACALQTSALSCWGLNTGYQLGNNTTTQANSPTTVTGSWSSISAGSTHACAISTTATLWCWGNGANGRVGNGSTSTVKSPVRIGSATDWHTVSAGSSFTCGTRSGPAVWCWGANAQGALGLSDTVDRNSPTLLPIRGRPIEADSISTSVSLIQLPGYGD